MKKFLILILSLYSLFFSYNALASEDITKTDFKINVIDITPTNPIFVENKTSDEVANYILEVILTNMIIWLWALSLLIMTIGWWYMIIYHWQDELLSKWKSIFLAWIISLVVALSAWLIVNLVVYILY